MPITIAAPILAHVNQSLWLIAPVILAANSHFVFIHTFSYAPMARVGGYLIPVRADLGAVDDRTKTLPFRFLNLNVHSSWSCCHCVAAQTVHASIAKRQAVELVKVCKIITNRRSDKIRPQQNREYLFKTTLMPKRECDSANKSLPHECKPKNYK